MHHHTFTKTALTAALLTVFTSAYAEDAVELETVKITAPSGSMNKLGEVPFRQAKSAVAISADTLKEEKVGKLDEVGRYQAGFINQVFGSDSNTNWFRVRGAKVSQAVDGTPALDYGFFQPRVESYGMEAVEITKGADPMTFGSANEGGLINYISKHAHKDKVGKGEVAAHIGNKDQRGIAADYTGGLKADNTLRYRIVASYRKAGYDMQDTYGESYYIAPTLAWDITDRTKLNVLASFQKDTGTPSSQFFPLDASLLDKGNGKLSPETNFGDPTRDFDRNHQRSFGYDFSHEFGNGLMFNQNYRYSHVNNYHVGAYIYDTNLVKAGSANDVSRDYVFNHGTTKSHAIDNRLTWKFKHGVIDNTLVGGADYRHSKVDTEYVLGVWPGRLGQANPFNINSVYGLTLAGGYHGDNVHLKSKQLGFYLQNSMKIAKKVTLGLGVRHDRSHNEENVLTLSGDNRQVNAKKNHTSYNASLMWHAPAGFNPYVSYNEGFSLPTGLYTTMSSSGVLNVNDPRITKQTEIGVKYMPTWLDGNISLAYFHAKDKGEIRYTPSATQQFKQGDEFKRRGIELQANANLTENWTAALSYTYIKSDTTSNDSWLLSVSPHLKHYRTALFPRHSAALRTAYTFNQGALNGLTLGGGLRYVGSSTSEYPYAEPYAGSKVPSVTLVDLFARYRFADKWTAQLNVENVGNKTYISGCDWYCYYGEKRRINASISYAF
ncbi:TonB-dependent siderophore receptor [Neisseriaceae bacterium B1]